MTTRRPSDPLPNLAVTKIERFCDHKIPAHVRDQLVWEVETRGRAITIYERTRSPVPGSDPLLEAGG